MSTGFHFNEDMPLFTIQGQDIPIILTMLAAAVALEVFLSLKKDGRLGLVLPGLWLLLAVLRLAFRAVQVVHADSSWLANPGQALAVAFTVENIPTLFLLAAYGLCRGRKRWKTRRQLEQSRIKDL